MEKSDFKNTSKFQLPSVDLLKLPLLSCLSEQEIAIVRERCDACSFDPGEIILKRGELDLEALHQVPVVRFCGPVPALRHLGPLFRVAPESILRGSRRPEEASAAGGAGGGGGNTLT